LRAVRRNGPSSLAEDRSVYLFERISFRYFIVTQKNGYSPLKNPAPKNSAQKYSEGASP
jgi:hypothetical protein